MDTTFEGVRAAYDVSGRHVMSFYLSSCTVAIGMANWTQVHGATKMLKSAALQGFIFSKFRKRDL